MKLPVKKQASFRSRLPKLFRGKEELTPAETEWIEAITKGETATEKMRELYEQLGALKGNPAYGAALKSINRSDILTVHDELISRIHEIIGA